MPQTVLAADPPLISTARSSAPYSSTARSVSINVIAPLTRPNSARNVSSAGAMTSTSALPIPTTSNVMFDVVGVDDADGPEVADKSHHATPGTIRPWLQPPPRKRPP